MALLDLSPLVELARGHETLARAVARAARENPDATGTESTEVPAVVPADTASSAVRDLIDGYVQGLRFTVIVPGEHYSGMSAQVLLALLAARGKPLLEDTADLRPRVRSALLAAFSGSRVPSRGAMNAVASKAILEVIVARFRPGFGLLTGALRAATARGYLEFVR